MGKPQKKVFFYVRTLIVARIIYLTAAFLRVFHVLCMHKSNLEIVKILKSIYKL